MSENGRPQRRLPGGAPPVVTYSRHREEALPDVYDDDTIEPDFEPVAEWEAVEVPPEPPLHARRRAKPLVEEVRAPVDPDRFREERPRAALDDDEAPARGRRRKRSAPARLIATVAIAALLVGGGILVYAFTSSTSTPVSAPTLSAGDEAPGTVPALERDADAAANVREIPLDGSVPAPPADPAERSASTAPAEPVNTVPVAPPAPRPRPDAPPVTATVQPDFDQAAPLPPTGGANPSALPPPVIPPVANTPPPGNDDFISNIERTLQQTRTTPEPALSPTSEPIQLAPPQQQLAPPPQQQLAPPQQVVPIEQGGQMLLPPPPEIYGSQSPYPEPYAAPQPQAVYPMAEPVPGNQGGPIPPENIPSLDGQNQQILLPGDYMLDLQ